MMTRKAKSRSYTRKRGDYEVFRAAKERKRNRNPIETKIRPTHSWAVPTCTGCSRACGASARLILEYATKSCQRTGRWRLGSTARGNSRTQPATLGSISTEFRRTRAPRVGQKHDTTRRDPISPRQHVTPPRGRSLRNRLVLVATLPVVTYCIRQFMPSATRQPDRRKLIVTPETTYAKVVKLCLSNTKRAHARCDASSIVSHIRKTTFLTTTALICTDRGLRPCFGDSNVDRSWHTTPRSCTTPRVEGRAFTLPERENKNLTDAEPATHA
jgi:hypothetical protein